MSRRSDPGGPLVCSKNRGTLTVLWQLASLLEEACIKESTPLRCRCQIYSRTCVWISIDEAGSGPLPVWVLVV